MKLTGLLKNKVEEAQTREEKKAIIAEAGMELTDEELDGVVGGAIHFPIRTDDGASHSKPTRK